MRRPPRRVLLGLAVLFAVGGLVVALRPVGGADVARGNGRVAPTFRVPDVRDPSGTVSLADFRGRPVVLNFWASWCVPCRREMPDFQSVHRLLGDRVAFVGMNHQDGRRPARELLSETKVTYPSGYDPDGDVARAYRLLGMPTTIFISADGRIVGTRTGELRRSELEESIRTLFADDLDG